MAAPTAEHWTVVDAVTGKPLFVSLGDKDEDTGVIKELAAKSLIMCPSEATAQAEVRDMFGADDTRFPPRFPVVRVGDVPMLEAEATSMGASHVWDGKHLRLLQQKEGT